MLVVNRKQAGMSNLINEFFNNEFVDRIEKNANSYVPKANITEEEKHYTIQMLVPGFDKESFELNIEDSVLKVSASLNIGEDDEKSESNMLHSEYMLRDMARSFKLSHKVDTENIQASYDSGILSINLPKKEEVLVKKMIKVS